MIVAGEQRSETNFGFQQFLHGLSSPADVVVTMHNQAGIAIQSIVLHSLMVGLKSEYAIGIDFIVLVPSDESNTLVAMLHQVFNRLTYPWFVIKGNRRTLFPRSYKDNWMSRCDDLLDILRPFGSE